MFILLFLALLVLFHMKKYNIQMKRNAANITLFTFHTPIIYDNSALQAELFVYKGDLSVKSNSCLITFKDPDPLGSAFELLKGVQYNIVIF